MTTEPIPDGAKEAALKELETFLLVQSGVKNNLQQYGHYVHAYALLFVKEAIRKALQEIETLAQQVPGPIPQGAREAAEQFVGARFCSSSQTVEEFCNELPFHFHTYALQFAKEQNEELKKKVELPEHLGTQTENVFMTDKETILELELKLALIIKALINFANASADNMEGAGMPEFSIYEYDMMSAIALLKEVGVQYDPISGRKMPFDVLTLHDATIAKERDDLRRQLDEARSLLYREQEKLKMTDGNAVKSNMEFLLSERLSLQSIISQQREAGQALVVALAKLSERNSGNLTYFEASPIKDEECGQRWFALSDAIKALNKALSLTPDTTLLDRVVEVLTDVVNMVGDGYLANPAGFPARSHVNLKEDAKQLLATLGKK